MKIMSDIDTGIVSIIFESREEKQQMHDIIGGMLDDDECMVFCYYPEDSISEEDKKKTAKNMAKIEEFLLKQRGSVDDILEEMMEDDNSE
jgi:hypothetical protein